MDSHTFQHTYDIPAKSDTHPGTHFTQRVKQEPDRSAWCSFNWGENQVAVSVAGKKALPQRILNIINTSSHSLETSRVTRAKEPWSTALKQEDVTNTGGGEEGKCVRPQKLALSLICWGEVGALMVESHFSFLLASLCLAALLISLLCLRGRERWRGQNDAQWDTWRRWSEIEMRTTHQAPYPSWNGLFSFLSQWHTHMHTHAGSHECV